MCTDKTHPVYAYIEEWASKNSAIHEVSIISTTSELTGGDFLFLISASEIVSPSIRELYKYTLVLHASDLPNGKGWSPHIWEIINGKTQITLSLIEALEKVDTGDIWFKKVLNIGKHWLWYEINHCLFSAEIQLIEKAINEHNEVKPIHQPEIKSPSYYRKRTPADSEVNPEASISSQFNLIRVCDPNRYPAYMKLYGHKYKIILEKIDE
tara:strand:+ start:89238 stop:89867 length:630 start_codon:yes stop_codon:yes gene_type:complete